MPDAFLFAGLGSAAVSAIFYAVYRNKEGVLSKLQNVVQLPINTELIEALIRAENNTIPYAAIRGEVKPEKRGSSIRSSHNPDAEGVIQKIKTKELKSEWSRTTRLWHDTERTISSSVSSVPFALTGKSFKVSVSDPLEAHNLEYKTVYNKFEPASSQTVTDSLIQWASGDKTKGFQTVEEMVEVGSTLTGIGELKLSEDGVIRLGPPSPGFTYFLSQLTIDGIMKQFRSNKKIWKAISLVFACGSGILLLISIYYYWKKRRERLEHEEIIRQIREENHALDNEQNGEVCVICLDQPRNVVILDCGHICACRGCAEQLRECPVCRALIARLIPTYNA